MAPSQKKLQNINNQKKQQDNKENLSKNETEKQFNNSNQKVKENQYEDENNDLQKQIAYYFCFVFASIFSAIFVYIGLKYLPKQVVNFDEQIYKAHLWGTALKLMIFFKLNSLNAYQLIFQVFSIALSRVLLNQYNPLKNDEFQQQDQKLKNQPKINKQNNAQILIEKLNETLTASVYLTIIFFMVLFTWFYFCERPDQAQYIYTCVVLFALGRIATLLGTFLTHYLKIPTLDTFGASMSVYPMIIIIIDSFTELKIIQNYFM
ncbi:hypothetical protein PPERSA_00253 [Pseudocohnilembus persalinus]|uniref:Transmembrane protein n=1 Tax=Pseudocohnilembus persalinus TaxID=266149 RepID=A0A0V0Q8V8_PSEPJ|nr:hypothetical protein PPERSA_00253 [Pseudocohnilembus persalinus]|eukprot:KRW98665.1 hypothetical protein PPERSA_00253 [Pseudocohnilembus persalinus]